MATKTSNASGLWSATGTWVGGVIPADGDDVIIAAGHSVLMNVDLSAWTGVLTLTIQGSESTPGMLYFMSGTNGFLKLRDLSTSWIIGTSGTNKGRILANSDGVWANTGALAFANKAIIQTRLIDCTYLEVRAFCTEPTIPYTKIYGPIYTVTHTDSVFTGPTLGNGMNVSFKTTGTLPEPLREKCGYYVSSASGNTFKVKRVNSLDAEVVLTSAGSGTLEVCTQVTTSTPILNTVNANLTTDPCWTNIADHNIAFIVSFGSSSGKQLQLISSVGSTSITFTANITSVIQPPGYLVLLSRNVSFRFYTGGTNLFLNLVNSTIQAECRNVTSTGAVNTSYSGICFKNPVNNIIRGVITHFYYPLNSSQLQAEISAVVVNVLTVLNANSLEYCPPGQVITSPIFACSSVAFGMTDVRYNGVLVAASYIYNTCYSCIVDFDTEGASNIFANCVECRMEGNTYSARTVFSGCYKCIMPAGYEVSGATWVIYGGSECFVSSHVDGAISLIASTSATAANIFNGTVEDSNLAYHTLCGTLVIKNTDLSLPLRFGNLTAGTVIEAIPSQIWLENINDTNTNDGLYCEAGKALRVAAGSAAYVPSVSYDGINDMLMACDFTTKLSSVHKIPMLKSLKVWCEPGARTLRVYVVNGFTALSAGGVSLKVTYDGASGVDFVTNDTSVPSTATDWSQYVEVSFTQGFAGFVDVYFYIEQYEAGARFFIHPWPVVS